MINFKQTELPKMLCERDAALYLGCSIAWLQKARYLGHGPRYCKIGGQNGRAIRYRLADLEAYVTANMIETTDSRGV